jgi:hypothetical protein
MSQKSTKRLQLPSLRTPAQRRNLMMSTTKNRKQVAMRKLSRATTMRMNTRRANKTRDPEETITEVSTEITSDRMKAKRAETPPREVAEAATEASIEAAEAATEASIEVATEVATEAAEVVTNLEKMLMTMASKLSRKRPISPREVAAEVEAAEAVTEVAEAGEAMATLATTDPRLIKDPDAAEEK